MAEAIAISEVVIGRRHRQALGDIRTLARSIEELGLLQPIVITPGRQLIAGYRRLEACRRLGWRTIPVHVVDLEELVKGELAENAQRKPFTPSEIVAISREIRPLLAQEADVRRRKGLKVGKDRPEVEISPLGERGKTRDRVAAYCGVSGRTLEKMEAVVAAAESNPERYGDLATGMDRSGKVHFYFKTLRVRQDAERLARGQLTLPTGPFRVVVADPPWPYDLDGSPHYLDARPYPSMSVAEIAALPVMELAEEDAVLWLWTTNVYMRQALELVECWGFTQKTILTWVKEKVGCGNWLRGQTEHCLFAIRGKPSVTLEGQSTVLFSPRRRHSEKPEEFYQMVESLCPGNKVELFARQRRSGWTCFGQ